MILIWLSGCIMFALFFQEIMTLLQNACLMHYNR